MKDHSAQGAATVIKIKRGNWTKRKVLFLFIIPVFLYIALLPVMPLTEPDEARYSDIASLMNRTGDYVTPRLNHVVYLEKPPLGYWATALFFIIFGENEFSSRLFAALCAWGCVLLVYRIGKFFVDDRTGLYAAGVLSTFSFHYGIGRTNILDMPLAFFVCLAIWAGYRYFEGVRRSKGWIYLLYISSALAFLTKGLIGIVFPVAVMVVWLSVSKRWRDLPGLFSPVGILLFLLISCPWVILVQKANKDFLQFFFVQHHFLRYAVTHETRNQSPLFYIPVVVLGTLPWSAFLLKAFREGRSQEVVPLRTQGRVFLLVWIFLILVFFSVSSSKLVPYIAPIFLPIAVFLGHRFRMYEDRQIENPGDRKLLYDLPIFLQALLLFAVCFLPFVLHNTKVGSISANLPFRIDWRFLLFPLIFQVMLIFLPPWVERRRRRAWFPTVAVLSAFLLGSLTFPVAQAMTPFKSARPVSEVIRAHVPVNGALFQFKTTRYGIDFYNKIRTPYVEAVGELGFGLKRFSAEERCRSYLSFEEFCGQSAERNETYCVTRYRRNVNELRRRFPSLEVLWDNGHFYLLRLRESGQKPMWRMAYGDS